MRKFKFASMVCQEWNRLGDGIVRFRNVELMMASLNEIIKRCRQSGDVESRVFGCENNIGYNLIQTCLHLN